ncbi:CRISPR-associated helicase/endonuclease Cas3 [Pseudodonghicola xiamenensis]|uniref:CRISPR-associated helicase/endonuclease Cas3 n=1 Tax=Pseudodonghicola xiamenensis TaxID=337702 RepID=A0A8J3H9S9_9RHOB|nr:CRISPR-associated helicase/endonuclease Cas3 [Pseudodonghicola xiamenensis]GHG98419.1 CRISPR-associated helicase/endonuclease Cas3 [Pseudodonghicola xiamenensis]
MRDLLNWPGKSAPDVGGVEHPAVYHMLDVAAVAERLIAPFGLDAPQRDALVFLIALHDLGKISEGFRAMLRGEAAGGGPRHWQVSEVLLRHHDDLLATRLGCAPHRRAALYAAVAGHHGRPSDLALPIGRHHPARHGPQDVALKLAGTGVAVAREVIAAFAALWPGASLDGLSLEQAQRLSWWLAGLCTTADWIGSNTDWFAPNAQAMPLSAYLAQARLTAVEAVEGAGLGGCDLRQGPLFDFAPRPMQEACAQVPLPEGPMLAVIEDETGAGKTEAALLLAQRMLAAGKGRGLFFALPTMATADAMFERAAGVVGRMFDAPRVTLAHGRAGLSVAFRDIQQGRADSPDDVTCTDWLAQSRRRALLADVGVGTIDQALLAVLPVKFQTLRYFGLSSKILIVDEVHELGEPYIGAELEALLRMHRAAGGSAILLTATLPVAQRAKLLAVYDGQAPSPTYPALTVAGGAAVSDFPQATGSKGPVRVVRLGRMDEAVEVISGAAARGAACVWVRNSVDDAIAAVQALQEAGIEADLLHARFALGDRKRIEAAARGRFGKDGRGRAGRVLVGTQVLESSLDFDFDVMVSDLAPMAALVQRAGRLWRHMAERPQAIRPVPAPILHVLAPDPAQVSDDRWLQGVLGGGAFVYPLADQWRTADHLFRVGEITAPSGLRALIEAVHGAGARDVPQALEAAELRTEGEGAAARGHAAQNIVDFAAGYRAGGRANDDARYPTRLGEEQQTLVLARYDGAGGLQPWIAGSEGWALSEVSASRKRLARFDLPDQDAPEIVALTRDWPEWKRAALRICPVAGDGTICPGLRYETEMGLVLEVKS